MLLVVVNLTELTSAAIIDEHAEATYKLLMINLQFEFT